MNDTPQMIRISFAFANTTEWISSHVRNIIEVTANKTADLHDHKDIRHKIEIINKLSIYSQKLRQRSIATDLNVTNDHTNATVAL